MREIAQGPTGISRELGEVRGLAVFSGDGASHSLALLLAAGRVSKGPVLVLDGGNRFDPYLLSDLARLSGTDPDSLLSRILVSRAFTCHQLHRLVQRGLPKAVKQYSSSAVVGLGVDTTFHDEMVPLKEARRLWREVLEGLRRTSRAIPVLLTVQPPSGRRSFLLRDLLRSADFTFRLERRDGEILIARERPSPGAWVWSEEMPGPQVIQEAPGEPEGVGRG